MSSCDTSDLIVQTSKSLEWNEMVTPMTPGLSPAFHGCRPRSWSRKRKTPTPGLGPGDPANAHRSYPVKCVVKARVLESIKSRVGVLPRPTPVRGGKISIPSSSSLLGSYHGSGVTIIFLTSVDQGGRPRREDEPQVRTPDSKSDTVR